MTTEPGTESGREASSHGRPLDGVMILDFSQMAAGPWCTSLLGDLGATVVKVERPGLGDLSRGVDDLFGPGNSSSFVSLNRNKKSVLIDLATEEGRERAHALAMKADVLVENFTTGVMERLGLGYEHLADLSPRLIYCSIKGFGDEGPDAARPAVDTVMQGAGGLMAHTGAPSMGSVRVGAAVADFTTASLALYGITLALYEREQSGLGQKVSVSLLDAVVMHFANFAAGHAASQEPSALSGRLSPRVQPGGIYRTSDCEIVISAPSDRMWRAVLSVLGLEALSDDDRFADNVRRVSNREPLRELLEEKLTSRPGADWVELFTQNGVPASTLRTFGELLTDPQVIANRMVQTLSHATAGPVKVIGHPVRFSRTRPELRDPAPLLGEHTDEVLQVFREDGVRA
jgi:crotonobetainyl-CoA:carnitine CoA-transferase CaiB-like acyl-CoA transferase